MKARIIHLSRPSHPSRPSRPWTTAASRIGLAGSAAVLAGAIGLGALTGCHPLPPDQPGQAATAVRPTPEGRVAIARVASRELDGARAILDGDALTDDGVRVVDPSQLRPGEGRVERFHLIARGDRCLLVHDRTDRTYELDATACAAP